MVQDSQETPYRDQLLRFIVRFECDETVAVFPKMGKIDVIYRFDTRFNTLPFCSGRMISDDLHVANVAEAFEKASQFVFGCLKQSKRPDKMISRKFHSRHPERRFCLSRSKLWELRVNPNQKRKPRTLTDGGNPPTKIRRGTMIAVSEARGDGGVVVAEPPLTIVLLLTFAPLLEFGETT